LRSFGLALDHGADGFEVDVVALSGRRRSSPVTRSISAELCHGAAHGPAMPLRETLNDLRRLDRRAGDVRGGARARLEARLDGRPFLIDIKSARQPSGL
jgi:hypothetical protein